MKVRVIKMGFYENRRWKPGEVLEIPNKRYPKDHRKAGQVISFSPTWMEEIKPAPATAPAPEPEPNAPDGQQGEGTGNQKVI